MATPQTLPESNMPPTIDACVASDDTDSKRSSSLSQPHKMDNPCAISVVDTEPRDRQQPSHGDLPELKRPVQITHPTQQPTTTTETSSDADLSRPEPAMVPLKPPNAARRGFARTNSSGINSTSVKVLRPPGAFAWVSEGQPGRHRHRVTGAVYYNPHKDPTGLGPTMFDIRNGWEANLLHESEEVWNYVHRPTGIVIHVPPTSLPVAVTKEIDIAASYGTVPQFCQGVLKHGRIRYTVTYPSARCPDGWHTFRHPKLVEDDMDAFLANYEGDSSRLAKTALLTAEGQSLPIHSDDNSFMGSTGILLIEDIDQTWIKCLCAVFSDNRFLKCLIFGHLLFDQLHEVEAMENLVDQVKAWYWMSLEIGGIWHNAHYDIIRDDERDKLHFGQAQCPAMHRTMVDDLDVVRISTLDISSSLVVVLVRNSKPILEGRQKNPSIREKVMLPESWTPAVPTYLGSYGLMERDARNNIIRLLGKSTEYIMNATFPKMIADSRVRSSAFSSMVTYLLALYAWRDGIDVLSQEIEYFWEQAIVGPSVRDFVRLKAARKYAENLYRDLTVWAGHVEPLFKLGVFRSDDRYVNELKDLPVQISDLKQEISDTFQLLIGAIAIKDSEIQKRLAHESKIQAKRSTALTAFAAVYLPLSLATGVFGMNISEINKGVPKYWAVVALGLGLLVPSLFCIVWVFRDKGDEDVGKERLLLSGGSMMARAAFDMEGERNVGRGGFRHVMGNFSGSLRRRRGEARPGLSSRTERSGDTV